MITTSTQVKSVLQISDSTYDTFITAMIPLVQDFIFNYCNNYFQINTKYNYRYSSNITFTATDTITDSDNKLLEAGFTAGMNVRVQFSNLNDGVYLIDSAVAGSLTIASGEPAIATEDTTATTKNTILLTQVKFPNAISLMACQMIGEMMDKKKLKGVVSESLGDHSISYVSENDFSKSLLKGLSAFRKLSFVGK